MSLDRVTGVLLMAYGTPEKPEDVAPYYTHIRHGHPPTAHLLAELQSRYALVGGHTPLTAITEATRQGLQEVLDRTEYRRYRVIVGMKHWRPWIHEAVAEMAAEGIDHAVGLVLAPHYSSFSIAQYYGYVEQAQEKTGTSIRIDRIDSWHLHPRYLAAIARRVRTRLAEFPEGDEVTVIFTAHSLPEKIVAEGDLYPEQLRETSETLAEMLDLPHWTFSYQSAGRTTDRWLGPDLVDTVHRLVGEGVMNILVATIGFVSDHLEILYDIDCEAKAAADDCGVAFKRTESLNASPDFLETLADLVRDRVMESMTP
ncbi:MAG: ferrochelatase [Chloroflexota bacterium]|nr:MAG: ferrochelatase [Chloroflexota bacterium]